MPIIKEYHLEHDYEDTNAPQRQTGTLLKASVLSPMDDVVTPSQFSTEISYREPTEDVFLKDSFILDEVPAEVAP